MDVNRVTTLGGETSSNLITPVNKLKFSTTREVKNKKSEIFEKILVAGRVTDNFLLFCTEHDLQI